MTKSLKKTFSAMMATLLLALALVVPAYAATYPDDGNYSVEYEVLHAVNNTTSMLDVYRDGDALVTVSDNGNSQVVTVKFTSDSYITDFYVDQGAGYAAATPLGNYTYSFSYDGDFTTNLGVKVSIAIPGPLPGFPDGYYVDREARFSFDYENITEL